MRGLPQLAEWNSCASLCHGVNEHFNFILISWSTFWNSCIEVWIKNCWLHSFYLCRVFPFRFSAEMLHLVCIMVPVLRTGQLRLGSEERAVIKKSPELGHSAWLQADCERYIYVGSDQSQAFFYSVSQHDFNYGGVGNYHCWVTAWSINFFSLSREAVKWAYSDKLACVSGFRRHAV